MGPLSQPPTPVQPGVEGFGPGRHLHGASLCGRVEAASWFRAETVGARLGGRKVALRPLRTWNGERASGEYRRLGPEGEPSRCPPPPQRSWRHQVTGWPGGGLQRSDSGGMVDKTDGTGRRGRPLPRGRGGGGTVPAPTRPWDLAVERTAEGGPGPNRRVGRRKGRGAGCPPGCGNRTIPAPGQQNARGRMKWRQGQRNG